MNRNYSLKPLCVCIFLALYGDARGIRANRPNPVRTLVSRPR